MRVVPWWRACPVMRAWPWWLACLTMWWAGLTVVGASNGIQGGSGDIQGSGRHAKVSASVDTYFSKAGLHTADVKWISVTNRDGLTRAASSGPAILNIQVDNGTKWLHLGGGINTFKPIVTSHTDPSAASDLFLEDIVSTIEQKTKQGNFIGLHVSPLHPSMNALSVSELNSSLHSLHPSFPLLVSATVLDNTHGDVGENAVNGQDFLQEVTDGQEFLQLLRTELPGATPVLGWATFHGMDRVWARIRREAILKDFQQMRVVRMVEQIYLDPAALPDSDVRFLEFLLKRQDSSQSSSTSQSSSFTVLVLDQLMAAIQNNGHNKVNNNDPFAKFKKYKRRKQEVREVLPEYYISLGHYSPASVDAMAELVTASGFPSAVFQVRAGLLVNQGSVQAINQLLDRLPGSLALVTALATDRVDSEAVHNAVDGLGRDRVIVGMQLEEREGRIKQPRTTSGGVGNQSGIWGVFIISLVVGFSWRLGV